MKTNPGGFEDGRDWEVSTTDSSCEEDESSSLMNLTDQESSSGLQTPDMSKQLGFDVFTNDIIERQIRRP